MDTLGPTFARALSTDGGTVSECRAFLRCFIESIETQDTKVAVRYTLPLPTEGIELDPTAVLDLVSLGGPNRTKSRTFTLMFVLAA